jgi:hypothetical protein
MGKTTRKDKPIESPEELVEFLRGCETVECVRVEARHLVAGQEATNVVSTWELPDDDETGSHFNAEEIYAKLLADASSWGGVQRYVLLAFRDGQKTPRERLPIQLDGGADGHAALSEPASAAGLVAQAHRHIETLMRSHVGSMQMMLNNMMQQTKVLSEQNEKLMAERGEVWQLLSDMHKIDREKMHEEARIKKTERQGKVLEEGVRLLLPGLINKVMPSNEAKESAVSNLIESLSPEQQEKIFVTLNPQQQAALGALLDKRIAKEEQPKEEAAQ